MIIGAFGFRSLRGAEPSPQWFDDVTFAVSAAAMIGAAVLVMVQLRHQRPDL